MLRENLRRAIANHPNVSLQGLCSLVSSSKKEIKAELKAMKQDGLLEVAGRYYRLKPLYTQLTIDL